jgi:hypothetical protein
MLRPVGSLSDTVEAKLVLHSRLPSSHQSLCQPLVHFFRSTATVTPPQQESFRARGSPVSTPCRSWSRLFRFDKATSKNSIPLRSLAVAS